MNNRPSSAPPALDYLLFLIVLLLIGFLLLSVPVKVFSYVIPPAEPVEIDVIEDDSGPCLLVDGDPYPGPVADFTFPLAGTGLTAVRV